MDMVTDFIEEAHMEWRPSFLFLQITDGPLEAGQRVIRRDCGRAGSLFSLMIKGEATQNLKETNHLPQTIRWKKDIVMSETHGNNSRRCCIWQTPRKSFRLREVAKTLALTNIMDESLKLFWELEKAWDSYQSSILILSKWKLLVGFFGAGKSIIFSNDRQWLRWRLIVYILFPIDKQLSVFKGSSYQEA